MSAHRLLLALLLPGLALGCGEKDADDSATDDSATDDSAADDSAADDSAADDSAADDSGEPQGAPLDLTILHINDHHSHLADDGFGFAVGDLGLSAAAEEVEVRFGGFPRLVTLFAERAAAHDNVLKLHAGDAVTGTLYYSLFGGQADADMMNRVCFDAFALGNHEFDNGDAGLVAFLDFLGADSCGTPALAANVQPAAASPLTDGYLLPYTLLEVDGQQVGVIGLDIAQKTMASSNPDEGTLLLDERETGQAMIDALTAQGVDKIILLTHYTLDGDLALAAALRGVDVIVGGDSHTLLGGEALDSLGFNVIDDYPQQLNNADGDAVCVVQAWEYAHLLGELQVSFDAEGVVTSCSGAPQLPFDGARFTWEDSEGAEQALSAEDAALVTAALEGLEGLRAVAEDSGALSAMSAYEAEVAVLEAQIIGAVSEDLCLERFPGQGRSSLCDLSDTYAHGSHISDLVAEAFLTVTPTADVAIQNAGGVRVDVASGDFSIADAYTLLPFANTLVTLEMTGQQLIDVLEDALSNALDDGGSTGSYPYAAGLRYEVDASASAGARVSHVEVNPRRAGSWTAIDPGATYTVVTNDFIASGQDGYDSFGVVYDAGDWVNTYTEYAQGMVDFVEALTAAGQAVERLPAEARSTQRYVGRDGCDHSARSDCSGY